MTLRTDTLVKTACPAKINLTFEILDTMPDGYHEVRSLMQSLSLEDEITFSFSKGSGSISHSVSSTTNTDSYPLDASNLISKAVLRYGQAVAACREFDIHVSVEKKIPIGAGLAGGSADAAATLVALNHFFDRPLTEIELLRMASTLGADVPFCLKGGTCIGTGRGDILQPIEHDSKFAVLLLKPKTLMVSTPWAYGEFDRLKKDGSTGTANLTIKAQDHLEKGLPLDSTILRNDLEAPVFQKHTSLARLRADIESLGGWTARLTGSGPTLFAVTKTRQEALALELATRDHIRNMKEDDAADFDIFVVEPVNYGARVVE